MADSNEIWNAFLDRAALLRDAQRSTKLPSDDEMREVAGELWTLLDTGPDPLKIAYRSLPEDTLADHQSFLEELIEGRLAWEPSGTPDECALSIGRQLRALDALLARSSGHEILPDEADDLRCTRSGVFIIPMARAIDAASRHPGPGNGYLRRAMIQHRVLPGTTGSGKTIEIKHDKHLLPEGWRNRSALVGAALFPGIGITWENAPLNSRVRTVSVPSEAKTLQAQVEGAYGDRFLAAVWPELCMPPPRRNALSKKLREKSADLELGKGPLIVAAGSWHEDADGFVRNVMHIMDQGGRTAWTFTKVTKFVGGGYHEANEPGDILRVLVSRDLLVSFAICSDFCETADLTNPFVLLNVDIILVPSLGSATAAIGHQDNCRSRSNIHGGQTFVVQQREPSETGNNVGWVVSDPKSQTAPVEDHPWSRRKISLK